MPDELVVDFDYMDPDGIEDDTVYTAWDRLHAGPDIVWTPCNGGHWILTRAEDICWVQESYEKFSHEVFSIPRGSTPIIMPPITVDPPLHARYRAVLNPFFVPSKVANFGETARQITVELAEKLRPAGRCEFVGDFSRKMPVSVFLDIVDLPQDRREDFVAWALGFLAPSSDQNARNASLNKIVEYLSAKIEERAVNPGSDLLTRIVSWRENPRFQSEAEVIGMALVTFLGGIDTVANMLSFMVWHLATHPEHRRRIIEEPEIIPRAAEEYLRRYGLSNTGRLILSDVEYKGVTFKADEMVMVPISMSSLDERKHPNPFEVDFDRPDLFENGVPAHNTFGNGPHKCIGAPLARAELKIFLEEWLKRIPDFRLDPDRPPVSHSGPINGVDHLHLVWDV
ncbi:cytochrome P450 [Rhizorhabdus argentea]|uniref:cytochrome P450 n=1 Tax=Rhizorhabdus argentea TaxID=1387174 RepID=UPI0030EE483C